MKVRVVGCGCLNANCCIVETPRDKTIVIDPGAPEILDSLDRADLILLTHAHLDHVLGVNAVAGRFGCPVLVSSKEDMEACLEDFNGYADQSMIDEFRAIRITGFFNDGDEIEGLKVISTPGHTIGSSCFLGEGQIFTGDTIFAHGYGRLDFKTSSASDMLNSLRKLRNLPKGTTIYPGHDGQARIEDVFYF